MAMSARESTPESGELLPPAAVPAAAQTDAPPAEPVRAETAAPRRRAGLAGEELIARVAALEARMPEATQLIASVTQLGQNQQQLHLAFAQFSQQRGVAELQLERHTRATALDLAIKAVPHKEGEAPGVDAITRFAGAFLQWLKGGEH